jgi:hypothetical protein
VRSKDPPRGDDLTPATVTASRQRRRCTVSMTITKSTGTTSHHRRHATAGTTPPPPATQQSRQTKARPSNAAHHPLQEVKPHPTDGLVLSLVRGSNRGWVGGRWCESHSTRPESVIEFHCSLHNPTQELANEGWARRTTAKNDSRSLCPTWDAMLSRWWFTAQSLLATSMSMAT